MGISLGKTCEIKIMAIKFRMSVKMIYKTYSWDNVHMWSFSNRKICVKRLTAKVGLFGKLGTLID